jgi:hypothetical protein
MTDAVAPEASLQSDDALLEALSRDAFRYFQRRVNPANGLVADSTREGSPASIAVVGFALAAYPVAIERGWVSRGEALASSLAALRFFADSDQSGGPAATGYRGFYFHFLELGSGARMWHSELSTVDTAFLLAGALAASAYFQDETRDEQELRERAVALYERADWAWASGGAETLRQGWKPECGFLHYGWEGYSEAILMYALALGSPTHPLDPACYDAWTCTYQWENLYGCDVLYAGPLFTHQFSHAWLDLRGLRDRFMREKRSDYFENSRRSTHVQRAYADRNPREHAGYAVDCFGLTACDGPGGSQPGNRWLGYAARGVPYGPDDGTLSGTAALASLPFAPEIVLPTVRAILTRYPEILDEGQLASAFNPSLSDASGRAWVSPGRFGLDQGIALLMIENYRSGLVWRLTRECPQLRGGLRKAGFRGGWL